MADIVYEMTYGKVLEYREELEDRKTRVAAEIAERLKEARSHGDVTENSEFDDAKKAYADNEFRIMEIEQILKNAKAVSYTHLDGDGRHRTSCRRVVESAYR